MQFTTTLLVALASSLVTASPLVARQEENFQPFAGALGGVAAEPVTASGNAARPFLVEADTFVGFTVALERSCRIQLNNCQNAALAGGQDFAVEDCTAQERK